MKKVVFGFIMLFLGTLYAQSFIEADKLEKVWSTKDYFNTPESVCYDTDRDVLYVSNVGGLKPWMKDGYGFISKLSTNGTSVKNIWVDGMDAPKGMGIHNDLLYVADIKKLVVIDILEEKVIKRVKIPHAEALNDIAINKKGNVFITDSETNRVYRYVNDEVTVLIENMDFKRPNGLYCIGDTVLLATGTDIIALNEETGTYKMFLQGTGGVDGIDMVTDDTFIYSHWSGKLFLHTIGEEPQLILHYTSKDYNIADICYIKNKKQVFLPTFFTNTVECHRVLD